MRKHNSGTGNRGDPDRLHILVGISLGIQSSSKSVLWKDPFLVIGLTTLIYLSCPRPRLPSSLGCAQLEHLHYQGAKQGAKARVKVQAS